METLKQLYRASKELDQITRRRITQWDREEQFESTSQETNAVEDSKKPWTVKRLQEECGAEYVIDALLYKNAFNRYWSRKVGKAPMLNKLDATMAYLDRWEQEHAWLESGFRLCDKIPPFRPYEYDRVR